MKTLALLLLLTSSAVMAYEVDGGSIKLSSEEIRQCEKGKGCVIVTQSEIEKLVKQAFDEGQKAATAAAKKARDLTCRRDLMVSLKE